MRDILVTHNPDHMKGQISFDERAKQIDEKEQQEELARKREKQSLYKEFAQISLDGKAVKDVMLLLADSPAAAKIFWFIVQNMDGLNALIASYAVFQEALNMSRPTVARGLAKLREMGLLYVSKSGSSNVYLLSPQLVWKSWGNNLKYCEFPAKVLLAQSEQYPDAREIFKNQMHKTMDIKNKNNK